MSNLCFYSISSKSFGYGLLSHIVTADMAVISDAKPSVASTRRRFSQIPVSFIVIVITMPQKIGKWRELSYVR